ncbi:cob(I)yrinic acid a,c-diamide adenosyltransferase [Candidatus Omnitrophota bacterium]
MIHVYTGNGKGKTTAAFGLALRALGAGRKVYITQFAKGVRSAEAKAILQLKNARITHCGSKCFIKKKPSQQDIDRARKGFNRMIKETKKRNYDVILLDEINIALSLKLLNLSNVITFINEYTKKSEIILTGRSAPKKLIQLADYVTEMKDVKHPFRKGIVARKGIEL